MSSPLPLDPYESLGVSKDADFATIRTAHRKLVLKHHPDRIRDEAQREQGKVEFQKVQQAYEILSDATRRQRYDDKVKLAELQKERMLRREQERRDTRERDDYREPVRSSASRPTRPTAGPTSSSSRRTDGPVFEDRAPPADFFEARDYFDDHPGRASARKSDSYEKKTSAPKAAEKKEKFSKMWYGPSEGVSYKVASKMKEKAAEAKEKAQRQKEMRDRELRQDRSAKQSSRRFQSDQSDSDSDAGPPRERPPPRSSKPASRSKYDSETEGPRSRGAARKTMVQSDDEGAHEKWEYHHRTSTEYIANASGRRPDLNRSGSDAYRYWEGDSRSTRRSGSDSEKRPSAHKSRRSTGGESRPPPSMPGHNSAPSNLRPHIVDREPPVPPPEARRDAPSLSRSHTMPVRPKKDGSAPVRGSNLKHTETQDSGYYSSSSPHTPEMRGDSPPRQSSRRSQKTSSTRYTIVDPAESETESVTRAPRVDRRRIIDSDDEGQARFTRSPERNGRDRERERERPAERPRLGRLDTDSGRAKTSYSRYDSRSPRDSPSSRTKPLFGEQEERAPPSSYTYRPDAPHVRTSSYRTPTYSSYGRPETGHDAAPNSHFREQLKNPLGRRSSAAH